MTRISEGYFALLSRLTNKHGETHATSVRCERRSLKDERIGKWPEQILLKTYITISEGGRGAGSKFSKKKCTDQQEHVHLHVHQHVMHSCTCSSTCATPVNAHAHAHRIPRKKFIGVTISSSSDRSIIQKNLDHFLSLSQENFSKRIKTVAKERESDRWTHAVGTMGFSLHCQEQKNRSFSSM